MEFPYNEIFILKIQIILPKNKSRVAPAGFSLNSIRSLFDQMVEAV